MVAFDLSVKMRLSIYIVSMFNVFFFQPRNMGI